jgi:O-antigen ligase
LQFRGEEESMSSRLDGTSTNGSALGPFAFPALATASLGVLAGLLVLSLADLELRWVVYAGTGVALLVILLVAPRREALLWAALVFGLQFDVSLRALYGHAGSQGFTFPLPALVALFVAGWSLASGQFRQLSPMRWGGALALPIAALFATDILSIVGSTEKFVGLTTLLTQCELLLIYLLALNCVRSEEQLGQTLKLLLLVLAVQAVVYYIEISFKFTLTLTGETLPAGQLPRPGGTVASSPSGFTDFVLPLLLIATALFLRPQLSVRGSLYLGLVVVLGLGALTLSLTRAAWGGFALGLAWMVVVGHQERIISRSKLIGIVASGMVIATLVASQIAMRLQTAPTQKSYSERVALMHMAVNVIEAHPLTGVGPGAYSITYKSYLTPDLERKWQWTVHNYYLLRTAETGILGGFAWLALIVAALRQAMRGRRSPCPLIRTMSLGWSAGIIGLCFTMYWDMWTLFTTQSVFWFLLGLMGAAEALDCDRANRKVDERP